MARFGFESEGTKVVATFADRVNSRTFVITGPSQGSIGGETAISLASGATPALIVLTGRNESKIAPIIDAVTTANPRVKAKFVKMDLASQPSIRTAATEILSLCDKIDVLINNAGIMAHPYSLTSDGIESQFGTNHVGHFLLTSLLMPHILAAAPGSRIVNVSSNGHNISPVRFDDYNFSNGTTYNEWLAYGQAKTANILHAKALASKLSEKGVNAYSLHPGMMKTNLGTHVTPESLKGGIELANKANPNQDSKPPGYKTLQQGCATTLVAALDPSLDNNSGAYLEDCNTMEPASHARSQEDAVRLWRLSEQLVGESFAV